VAASEFSNLEPVIDSCERFLKRLWYGDLALAAAVSAFAAFGAFADWRQPASGLALASVFFVTGIAPHVLVRIGLSRTRLARLRCAEVDPDHFSLERIRLRRIVSHPLRVDVELTQNIVRADIEALPEEARRLVPVVQAAMRWNVVRLHGTLVGVGAAVLLLDPARSGAGRLLMIAAYALLMMTCYPRISPWVSRASAL
jgi:hypothetical protein